MNAPFENVLASRGAVEALAILLKVTLLLGVAWALSASLRRLSAAVRHFVWLLALGGSLALLLAPAPRVEVATPYWPASGASLAATTAPAATTPPPRATVIPPPVSDLVTVSEGETRPVPALSAPRWSLTTWAVAAWLLGVAIVFSWHALGYLGLGRLARAAARTRDPRWHWILGQSARDLGIAPVAELRKSAEVGSPLVCGLSRPTIVLPIDADEWPESRRRAVALHELAHVARRDALSQLLAGLACAVYWFHPGVWMAARRLRAESERACDDRVLALGFPPADYATHLLEVAKRARTLRLTGLVAIAMARRSTLEGRLLSLLDAGRKRGAPPAWARAVGVAGFALVVATLAGIRPVARATEAPTHPAAVATSVAPPVVVASPTTPEPAATTQTEPAPEVVASNETASEDVTTIVGSGQSVSFSDEVGIPYHGKFEIGSGGTLRLRLDTGAGVKIIGWSRNLVEIEGKVGGRNQEDVAVEMHGSGDEASLRLEAKENHYRNFSTSSHFEIHVPKRFDVDIQSAGGEVLIDGVEGEFRGTTGGGEITLHDLSGRSRLSTGGGDVEVSDCRLSGTVSTGGGLVKISRVSGGLRGSSGSGPVIYAEGGEGSLEGIEVDKSSRSIIYTDDGKRSSRGALNIEKAGGDIELNEAPNGAKVNTGGGDVRIGRADGMVRATTGGGNVTVGPVVGSLVATTGAGEVRVRLSGRDGNRTIDLSSGYGPIILEVPSGLGVELDLETSYTRAKRPAHIRSDIPVEIDAEEGWDDSEGTPRKYVRAHATSGSGRVQVRVKTVNGDIEIRRPR